MKSFSGFLILGLLLIINIKCAKVDCLSSAGKRTNEKRKLDAFNRLELYDCFNVYLKRDTFNQIVIEAGNNEIRNVETTVLDKTLTIKDLNACGFIKGYGEKNLYITFDSLSEIDVNGGINMYTSDTIRQKELKVRYLSDLGHCDLTIDCQFLDFEVWYTSGDFVLRGKAGYFYLNVSELSFTEALDLEAGSCYVYSETMGDCYVNTKGTLDALIKNSGNIYYKGPPQQINLKERTGTGKLIKIE